MAANELALTYWKNEVPPQPESRVAAIFVENRYLPNRFLFAVINGSWGEEPQSGATTGYITAAAIQQAFQAPKIQHETPEDRGYTILMHAHQKMLELREAIGNVAVKRAVSAVALLAEISLDDHLLTYSNVGDATLWHMPQPPGRFEFWRWLEPMLSRINQPERYGGKVTNALGLPDFDVKQQGTVEIKPYARIALCTSGVTGIQKNERMPETDMLTALSRQYGAKTANRRLLSASLSSGSKAAIVIDAFPAQPT